MLKTETIVSTKDPLKFKGDLLVYFASSGKKENIYCDKHLKEMVGELHKLGDFSAKENETILFYPSQYSAKFNSCSKRTLVVGLGENESKEDANDAAELFRSVGGTISKLCEKHKVKDVLITVEPNQGLKEERVAECLAEGIVLGDYRFTRYRKKKDTEDDDYTGIRKLIFTLANKDVKPAVVRKGMKKGVMSASGGIEARNMANEPGNHWTATHFADYAKKLSDRLPLRCRVLNKNDLKKMGMGGILAVNQGSAEPPKLIILEYTPAKYKQTIMLVGKGLTFDSGGVSIKPAAGMQDMKYDMCGGAAVLGAIQAIAEDGPSVRVVALIPATDNMSGSNALKPGDIVKHYSGVTSEIINTDAEGRLILADALAYGIEKYAPDCVVDVATLTGAVIIGLGHHHTGLLSNNDKIAEKLIAAGKHTGEPLWRLPLGKEYSKQIESKVADIKNAGGRDGGTITAAAYLENFVGETPWAHLDIAGTAWDFTEKTYIPKGPSGIMVRTLVQLVRDW